MKKSSKAAGLGKGFFIAVFFVSAALITCTIFWLNNMRKASEETINLLGEFYLREITEKNAFNISASINSRAEQVKSAVEELDNERLNDENSVRKYISMIKKLNDLDYFALVDENKIVYTSDSTFPATSEFGFLSNELKGVSIYTVNNSGDDAMLAIAVPVVHRETDKIHIVACITAINVESVINSEQSEDTENTVFCRMFDKEGNILVNISGEYPERKNLFEIYENSTVFADGYSLDKLKSDWQNGEEGYCVYYKEGTESSYLYYKNVPGTDWVLTSLMRESSINSAVESGSQKMVLNSVLLIATVTFSLAVLFLFSLRAANKIRKSQSDREQLKIVGALSNDYTDVFLIDLINDKSVTLKEHGRVHTIGTGIERSYKDGWKSYAERYVAEEDRERVLSIADSENIASVFAGNDEFSFEFKAIFKGEIHYLQAKIVKLPGEQDRLILGFKNIDEQVEAEEKRRKVLKDALDSAQHANRAKTVFLNNMSHDIRTPMNAIVGYTSLAAENIDNKEQVRDYLSKIQTSGSHLQSLINDVLDMSRIESGKVKIDEKEVHLPDVIHALRSIVQADISAKQLEFYIDTVDVVNEDIICDKLRLNQILLNILSNAMKFTRPGGVVSLRIIQTEGAPSGYASYEFCIKDTGIGMSREFQEHVFEAFSREQNSTVSGIQGTGLGMSITKSIVDLMGGEINVSSEQGKGTEFVVKLNFRISSNSQKSGEIPEIKGFRALVADDDADACLNISKMLQSIGMRSEWTTTGKEAVLRAKFARSENDEFYAYIIDWQMPDMNGLEVVRKIRSEIGDSAPIIIITTNDWTDIQDNAKKAGVTAFCSKPVFLSELRGILTENFRKPEPPKKKPPEKPDFSGNRILLVEDNRVNQEIAAEILKKVGISVEIAADGEIAVEKVRNAASGQYDMILMDIMMPRMNGYEATRQIRALDDPEKANLPIVAMTANAFEEDKKEAANAGMNGHLAKPVDIAKLFETLALYLKKRG